MKNIFFAACSLILLSGCSTVLENSSQRVTFETVGAQNALCAVMLGENQMRYTVHPPQKVWIKKSSLPLNVDCNAPGNRHRSLIIESEIAGTTFLNAFNGTLGAFYDGQSGAMFKYPDNIIIDFSDTVAELAPLPSYHNTDTIPPDQAGIEYMGPDTPKLQEDASTALRHRMAQMKADQEAAAEAALEAEKEDRKSKIEGGFYGDKEKAKTGKSSPSEPKVSSPAQDQSGSVEIFPNEVPDLLREPTFPSTTSF